MTIQPPPIMQPLIDSPKDGLPSIPWALFFEQIFNGDYGVDWTPNFVGLTSTGAAPTFTGRLFQISRSLAFFTARIQPGTNTSATAATTYINNFPLKMLYDGFNVAVSAGTGTGAGHCDLATNRVYTPSWSLVPNPVIIVGMVAAQ